MPSPIAPLTPPATAATGAPSSSPTAAERVYAHVKRRILSGELAGGGMISEGEIAEATGVSRTPVREAFLRLEGEGWLALYPKRGALVRPVAPGEADDILDARRMVELHAAQRLCALPEAARRRALAALAPVLAAQDAAIAAHDLAAYSSGDAHFHQGIVAAAGNEVVTDFYRGIRERQERVVAHSVRRDLAVAAGFVADHHRLHEHLLAGDLEGFTALLTTHFAASRELLA